MKNKICFIIPYFGKLPSYFPLFLNSIKGKPFDVLFFTDIDKPADIPENVLWNITALEDIRSLFVSKLNIQVSLERPYKFCDYKPSYGLVFENYIDQYHFWGSIDVD